MTHHANPIAGAFLALAFSIAAATGESSSQQLSASGAPPQGATAAPAPASDDPYLWLEEVEGEKALAWARAQNARAQQELEGAPGFAALRDRLRAIYDSKEKIPFPSVLNEYVYNFWRDETNPQGLWRRTSLAEYKKPAPKWEVVIDVDALSKAESTTWVWHGAKCLYPAYERCLVSLSRGGSDADVVREFDASRKEWVAEGFTLPEAKTQVGWKDLDTIYVGTDFGPGSLTDSGYPRMAKEWKRGTPLTAAKTIYEGRKSDIAVAAYREWDHGKVRDWVGRAPSFFTNELYLRTGDTLTKVEKPDDADADVWDDTLLIRLRTAWKLGSRTWPAGALLATPLAEFQSGKRDFSMLFEPKPNTSLEAYSGTKSAIFVVELEDVKSVLYVHTRGAGGWQRARVEAPPVGSFSVQPYDEDKNDDFFFTENSFTAPTTLSLGNAGSAGSRSTLKQAPAFFKADGVEATQHFATSSDGTRVPYFQVAKHGLPLDGSTPTVLEGYGGFEVSLTPSYDATAGAAWIERGGVFVVANIRGGGEYGPGWHQAALKQNRQRAYDDFIAVAEDLIKRKVTSTPKLGIIGGSNGGLLVGVMLTQRPELWGAVVCQVPLLDMKRYHTLLAGASWMEEYGNPDKPEEWSALSKFSPYQNIKAGVKYPRTLFTTSTRDDRVHPGHARKMVARLLEHKADLLYYENMQGGHGGAANNQQRAYLNALAYVFFARQLGLP
jgi:prolyl oligopeptidase